LNTNNGGLECKINERKKLIGLGLQYDIYIDTSFDLITGEIIYYCNPLKKNKRVKNEKFNRP
jgi:hypothetical protein